MDVNSINHGGQIGLEAYSVNNKVQDIKEVDVENNNNFTKKDLDKAVKKLNKLLDGEGTHAEYEVHEKLGDIMVKIIDNDTKEVLMEVPSEKILDMVAKLCELVGVVFDKKA